MNYNGIEYTDTGAAVKIEIGGKAYANLKRVADAMNGTEGFDADNTPATALRFYAGKHIEDAGIDPHNTFPLDGGVADLVADLLDGVDTGEVYGSAAERRKLDALRVKLYAAFGWRLPS